MIFLQGGFPHILDEITELLVSAPTVISKEWQGVEKDIPMKELRNVIFEVDLRKSEDIAYYQSQIGPNLPWADEHFLERISGHPLNPAPSWTRWPYALSANRFQETKFEHTYPELYWPKYKGHGEKGKLNRKAMGDIRFYQKDAYPNEVGDLQDVIEQLKENPTTRQAYFPLFGPEFTGPTRGKRKPCSLGYHFLVRNDLLHCHYDMRSVDFKRHMRDDLYLTVRLMIFVLETLRSTDADQWDKVSMGTLSFRATSLHEF